MWLMGPVMEEAVFSEWNHGFKNGAIMISDDFLVNAELVWKTMHASLDCSHELIELLLFP
jgi:hypothetical protein